MSVMGGRSVSTLCAIIVGLLLVGQVATAFAYQSTDSSPAASPESDATRTIVDSLGRTVEVPTTVDRVISLNSDLTEVIYALGAQDKLVVAGYRTSVGEAWLSSKAPDLAALPSPHTPAGINVEEVATLEPDLIISTLFGEVSSDELLETLEPLGIPIVIVGLEDLGTYFDDVRLVADLLGTQDRAEELIAYLRDTLDFVRNRTQDIPEEDRVRVYYSLADVYVAISDGIFEDAQLEIAGGINVSSSLTEFGTRVSAEQIIAWDPEVIITLWEYPAEKVLADPKLAPVTAVQTGRVYSHPEQGWGFATPRSIFAVLWIGVKLYPDLFADVDLEAEADRFYEAVYGFPYDGPPLVEPSATGTPTASPAA